MTSANSMNPSDPPETPLTAEQVKIWLKENPQFLQKNPEVLDELLPPQERKGKGVADFQYYMVKRLREDRNIVLESTKEIVQTSRENMNNLARTHTAILMLLEARNFEDFLRTVTMDFASILDVDIVTMAVEADGHKIPHIGVSGIRVVPAGTIDQVMNERTIALESSITGLEALYGGGAPLVKSQALVKLSVLPNLPPILLSFGSRDPQAYAPGQATDLLTFIGKVVERSLGRWLDLR